VGRLADVSIGSPSSVTSTGLFKMSVASLDLTALLVAIKPVVVPSELGVTDWRQRVTRPD